jgi:hypothetical protein
LHGDTVGEALGALHNHSLAWLYAQGDSPAFANFCTSFDATLVNGVVIVEDVNKASVTIL